jgi:hypothetical protein
MNKNNNNNFNINNMNFNFNKLKNHLPQDNHTYFFIIIGVILIVLIILIIRNFLHAGSLYLKYVKNVFFREMDNLNGKPALADNMKSICIQGNKDNTPGMKNKISNKFLHIKDNYLLMFWVKLDSEQIAKYISTESNIEKVPILEYSDSGEILCYPKFEMNIMNNEMSVYVNARDTAKSKLYNLPYDEWFCITSLVTNDHMDIYINGKLVKIIEYSIFSFDPSNKNNKIIIGPYPGYIAYLQVNNDSSYFNPANVYEEYLVYKSLIKRYVDNQYHKQYKITKIQNPKHDNGSYNRPPRKKEDKSNICKN